jgi:Domain of unknown function (DUF3368)
MGFDSPAWLRISSIVYQSNPLLDLLDRGERDAILLAESVKADRLIIDDLDGRREAANRRLPVIGTLGILAEAARRDLLDLSQALAALQATNFHAAPALIKLLLANDAERHKKVVIFYVSERTDTMRSVRFLTRRRVSASTASSILPTAWSSSAIGRWTPSTRLFASERARSSFNSSIMSARGTRA